jgi:hypothetical protein
VIPHWLELLAWVGFGFLLSLLVAVDILARGQRQQMGIMDALWPIAELYFGPVGL